MKNNNVKKVVFYSTRYIIPYFSEDHLVQCDSIIRYFSLLRQINEKTQKEKKDKFAEWLSDQALLSEYLQRITEIGSKSEKDGCKEEQEIINEISSIVERAENEDPSILIDELTKRVAEQKESCEDSKKKSFWKEANDIFIDLDKKYSTDEKTFLPEHFEKRKDYVLSGKVTHLNLGSDKQKPPKALLKHRLGIYHKEEKDEKNGNGYAVAAIWPWAGETEPNHDENWKGTILNAIREFYPQCDEIILAIHGEDFPSLMGNEKDAILFVGRKASEMYNPDATSNSNPNIADPRISLITFHHTNKNVLNPIQKKDGKDGLYSPKQVWELLNEYLKRDSLREADNKNSVAIMHNSTDNV